MPAPQYEPGFSFGDHSVSSPSTPQPGSALDAEFSGISQSINQLITDLLVLLKSDGSGLKNGVVGEDQLEAGLRELLTGDVAAQVQPLLDQASASAAAAAVSKTQAASSAAAAAGSEANVVGEAAAAVAARVAAEAARDVAVQAEADASTEAVLAGNRANSALGHQNQAQLYRDEANQWAEFIGGPVQLAPLDPDAWDDGFWSAKWWALKAREWGFGLNKWYLGAYAADPVLNTRTGEGLEAGLLYWNTTAGEMRVYDGAAWGVLQAGGGGGGGAVGEPGAEGFGIVVTDAAALRAIQGPVGDEVALITDGPAAGVWQFDVTLANADDGLSFIAPTDGTAGRWARFLYGQAYVESASEPATLMPGGIWMDTSA